MSLKLKYLIVLKRISFSMFFIFLWKLSFPTTIKSFILKQSSKFFWSSGFKVHFKVFKLLFEYLYKN